MDRQPVLPRVLTPYVTACFSYHAEGVPEYDHIGLPGPTAVLVIDLDHGLRLSGLGRQAPERFSASVAGLHASPATIHESGTSHGVMVYLSPLGTRALLGLPASELAGRVFDLTDVCGAEVDCLRARMMEAGDWACLDVLYEWLTRRVDERRTESVGLTVWDCVMAGAAARVSELADTTGWSARHLHHELRKELGHSPRTLLSLKRFAGTVEDVRAARPLADVAAEHGYADQAHLTREWRRFAGLAPTAWRRREQI